MMMKVQDFSLVWLLLLVGSVHSLSQSYLPIDCDDIYRHDNRSASGVYTIYPGGPTTPLHVYCDMVTDGGRWTVFLKRMDGSENFFRPWASYKSGFGNVAGEYWLGLENIYLLTMRKQNELRVDMMDWNKRTAYAQYSSFMIDSENSGYQLILGSFLKGTAGDSLSEHNSMKFTTFDKDQDIWDKNCAQHFLGGFWYSNCYDANPTGIYVPRDQIEYRSASVIWESLTSSESLKTISMKIRSTASCSCTK